MKHFKYFFIISTFFFLLSCEDKGEKFTGSPIGNGTFEDITLAISTPEAIVSSAQIFPFTVTLPKSFAFDVDVEVLVTGVNLSQRRAKITIPAGSLSFDGTISAPVAIESNSNTSTYTQSCILKVNALVGSNKSSSTYFKVSSNFITLKLGDSSVPLSLGDRCTVRLDSNGSWPGIGLAPFNDIDLIVKRNGVAYSTSNPANIPPSAANQSTTTVSRSESFSIMNSYPDGVFTFEPFFKSINSSTVNCRFVIAFPNNTFKSIQFQEVGLTSPSIPVERLKIRKMTDASGITYTIIP